MSGNPPQNPKFGPIPELVEKPGISIDKISPTPAYQGKPIEISFTLKGGQSPTSGVVQSNVGGEFAVPHLGPQEIIKGSISTTAPTAAKNVSITIMFVENELPVTQDTQQINISLPFDPIPAPVEKPGISIDKISPTPAVQGKPIEISFTLKGGQSPTSGVVQSNVGGEFAVPHLGYQDTITGSITGTAPAAAKNVNITIMFVGNGWPITQDTQQIDISAGAVLVLGPRIYIDKIFPNPAVQGKPVEISFTLTNNAPSATSGVVQSSVGGEFAVPHLGPHETIKGSITGPAPAAENNSSIMVAFFDPANPIWYGDIHQPNAFDETELNILTGFILETDYANPPFDELTEPVVKTKVVRANQSWEDSFKSGGAPELEWTQILNPDSEVDAQLIGLSGQAVRTHLSTDQSGVWSAEKPANPKQGGGDVPFTHPFGFDWNLDVHVDPQFDGLASYGNEAGWETELKQALYDRGLDIPGNPQHPILMHVEIDQGLIPPEYRPQADDRVAVFGRWVIDCGHVPFGSEIHPPLVIARAQSLDENKTHSTLVSRSFLVSQDFGDGKLRQHLLNQLVELATAVHLAILSGGFSLAGKHNLEAHPHVRTIPFGGNLSVRYLVRPARERRLDTEKLYVQFHFTVRTGVSVQVVNDIANDAVSVVISMDEATYIPPALPALNGINVSLDDLDNWKPGLGTQIKEILAGLAFGSDFLDPIGSKLFSGVVSQGVMTDLYDPPSASSAHDTELISCFLDALPSDAHFSVDDTQPFPIYGFLDVNWSPPPGGGGAVEGGPPAHLPS